MALRSLILALLILASASPVRAQSCDFGGADRLALADYRAGQSYRTRDTDAMHTPQTWAGATFWQGYGSATPFGAFEDLPLAVFATHYRSNRVISWIEIRGEGDVWYALLMDEAGKVAGSDVWHGCAAIVLDAATVDAWLNQLARVQEY